MAIIKRVQADSGQTAPNDSVSGDDLTGATGLTLVDRGADGFAWRFGTTSGDATVAISPAFNLPSNPSPDEGVTILMRYRLNTLGNDSSAPGVRLNVTSGDVFDYRKNGSSGTRGRWGNLSNAVSTVDSTLWSTGITRTLILRLTATSGVDNLDAWWNVASRPNNDPNFGVTNNGSTSNFNELLVGNFGNSEVEWFDVIVDDTPLTNAQCAAAADDLRGQYPLPTSGVSIIEQPVDQEALVNTGLVYDFSSLFDEGPNTPVTYTTNLNPSLGSIDSVA
ncbi:MAG: hypothetical protein QF704_13625, partial [Anaerolineales bacterium]|nr:hypothetical protein [Anaerolineales bacterium]